MVALLLSLFVLLPQILPPSDSLEIDPELLLVGPDADPEEEAHLLLEHLTSMAESNVERKDDMRLEVIQNLARRLEPSRAYMGDSSAYIGDRNGLTTRIKLSIGSTLRSGLLLDKDAGERFAWHERPPGFDFVAGYVQLERIGPFERVIIGDYGVRAGEGLLLRQGTSGAAMPGVRLSQRGGEIRPYASTSESGFFRGASFRSREFLGLSLMGFASRRRIDGRFDSTGLALLHTGLHRTSSERDARRAIVEEAAGAVLSFQRGFVHAGIASYVYGYKSPAGRTLTSASPLETAFLHLNTPSLLTSFEAAVRDAAISTSLSFEFKPARTFSLNGRWWSSERTAIPLHTRIAATSSGAGRAEELFDAACRVSISPAILLHFRSNYRRYVSDRHTFPLRSAAADAGLELRPRTWFKAHLQMRQRRTEDGRTCRALRCTHDVTRNALRLQLEYAHSTALRVRMRIEAISVRSGEDIPRERGILLFEDVRWRIGKRLRVDMRLSLFDTSGFESRAFVVEDDLLYSFSSPALSGRGRRGYLLVTLTPSDRLSIRMKYAATIYEDVRSVGSGRDLIEGSRVSDLKVQVRWVSR